MASFHYADAESRCFPLTSCDSVTLVDLEMTKCLKLNPFISKLRISLFLLFFMLILHDFSLCFCLNNEGLALLKFKERVVRDPFNALSNWKDKDGAVDPCSWFGVECSDGNVVVLNLKDLCLGGTLAPELGNLAHIKSIILRNNSLSGIIPKEFGELKELEMLDLGYNNFSGPLPYDLGNNLSLAILLLDNNNFLESTIPELHELQMLSEYQVDENQLSGVHSGATCNSRSLSWFSDVRGDISQKRRLLQVQRLPKLFKALEKGNDKQGSALRPSIASPPHHPPVSSPSPSPTPSPSPSPSPTPSPFSSPSPSKPRLFPPSPAPAPVPSSPSKFPPAPAAAHPPAPSIKRTPVISIPPASPPSTSLPFPASTSTANVGRSVRSKHHKALLWSSVIAGSLLVFISVIAIIICRSSKMVTVKPWATGLSGQLQKAFVSGVPKLKRSELEAACEDFSNIIGSLADGMVYKGTLSSGIEIAVVSSTVKTRDEWSKNLEAQFRKKIETLSKVNHKNFVNLIGYCEEEKPFTRMMVFEYAPNGTLFEHLHIKEAERLDWGTRLRILMGMAYCLDHMHQLNPPIPHRNLLSSSIYLTEDYAAKVSDFSFWNEITAAKMASPSMRLLDSTMADLESNVYGFGIIILEIITGKMPYSEDNRSLANWVVDNLKVNQLPREIIDPTLNSFEEDEVKILFEIVKDCVRFDPKERPTMREAVERLKEITSMEPGDAIPKLSPLWWAELEILSAEGN